MTWTDDDLKRFLEAGGEVVCESATPNFNTAKARESHAGVKVVGDVTRVGPQFRSRAEERAWNEWLPTIDHVHAEFEPISLNIDGALYKPDVVLLRPDGELWFIEVKGGGGFAAYKSGRSSKRSLRQCARHFAWMGNFYLLQQVPQKDGGGWIFEKY